MLWMLAIARIPPYQRGIKGVVSYVAQEPAPRRGLGEIWCNVQTFQEFRNTSQTCSGAGDCSHRFILLPVTRHSSLITLITYPDYVWIAGSLIPTHVSSVSWFLRPEKSDYLITYLITIYYYIYYLSRRSKILKTQDWKQKTGSYDYFN